MGRVASLILLVVLAGCGVAQAVDGRKPDVKHEQWDAIKGLPFGALIEVLPEGQAGPDACRVSSLDDSALTCTAEGPMNAVRLVFPRSAVHDVWVIEPERERHIVRWIMIGIGVALGITLCVTDGVVGAAIVGSVLMALETPNIGPPMPIRRLRPPRLHRRLIYRAP